MHAVEKGYCRSRKTAGQATTYGWATQHAGRARSRLYYPAMCQQLCCPGVVRGGGGLASRVGRASRSPPSPAQHLCAACQAEKPGPSQGKGASGARKGPGQVHFCDAWLYCRLRSGEVGRCGLRCDWAGRRACHREGAPPAETCGGTAARLRDWRSACAARCNGAAGHSEGGVGRGRRRGLGGARGGCRAGRTLLGPTLRRARRPSGPAG